MNFERAIEKQLLKRAAGPLCESLDAALKYVQIQLKFDSRDPKVRPLAFAFVRQRRKMLHAKLRDKRIGVATNRRGATSYVLRDGDIQAALLYLKEKYKDRIACALLSRPEDITRLYDGDAAQALLREYAYRCAPEFAKAILWLSQQEISRHAFAPKDDSDEPCQGFNDLDLSYVPGTEVSAIERDYHAYLSRRRELLIAERNAQSRIEHSRTGKLSSEFEEIDDEFYVLTDDDEDRADSLWREEYARLANANAAKKRLSELRAFGRKG